MTPEEKEQLIKIYEAQYQKCLDALDMYIRSEYVIEVRVVKEGFGTIDLMSANPGEMLRKEMEFIDQKIKTLSRDNTKSGFTTEETSYKIDKIKREFTQRIVDLFEGSSDSLKVPSTMKKYLFESIDELIK